MNEDKQAKCYVSDRSMVEWIIYKVSSACSGSLSAICSMLIIYMIVKRSGMDAETRGTTTSSSGRGIFSKLQNRLLLPLSIFDIIHSLALAPSTAMIPKGSPCTYGAIGNQFTCSLQGFMIKLGTAAPAYNAMLCLYYYCVLQLNMHESNIEKFEIYMHVYAILQPLLSCILAAAFSLYNNNILFCSTVPRWKYEFPPEGFVVNKTAVKVGLAVHIIFIVFTFLNVIIISFSMISIYGTAWVREKRMEALQFSSTASYNDLRNSTSSRNNTSSNNNDSRGGGRHTMPRRRSSSFRDLTTDTKRQALIYVGGYIITWTFPIVALVFNILKQPLPVFIRYPIGFLMPSQGIWNFLGFIRPRFKAISSLYPEKSITQRLLVVVFDKKFSEDDVDESAEVVENVQTTTGAVNRFGVSSLRTDSNSNGEKRFGSSSSKHNKLVEMKKLEINEKKKMMMDRSLSEENADDVEMRNQEKTSLESPLESSLDSPKERGKYEDTTKMVSFPLILESGEDNDNENQDCGDQTVEDQIVHETFPDAKEASNSSSIGKSTKERSLNVGSSTYNDRTNSDNDPTVPSFYTRNSLSALVAEDFISTVTGGRRRQQLRRHSTMNIQPLINYGLDEEEGSDGIGSTNDNDKASMEGTATVPTNSRNKRKGKNNYPRNIDQTLGRSRRSSQKRPQQRRHSTTSYFLDTQTSSLKKDSEGFTQEV